MPGIDGPCVVRLLGIDRACVVRLLVIDGLSVVRGLGINGLIGVVCLLGIDATLCIY
jgi:hypothetical protein